MTAKVFGIGLSRTGTTSLHEALSILGYRSIHYPPTPELYSLLDYYDAASDTPVAANFIDLDRRFPGSKFILTVRDRDLWLRSTKRLFGGPVPVEEWRREERRQLYGVLRWDQRHFAAAYDLHVARVRAHFVERRDDLLEFNVARGWRPLCQFLGKTVPEVAFPHVSFDGEAGARMPQGYLGQKASLGQKEAA